MKDDSIYPYYLTYLELKLYEGKLSSGALSLMRISGNSFDDFKFRFENDVFFKKRISEIYKAEDRDKKINDLFGENND